MPVTNFHGLIVLTLESRRGQEMSRLIETYGGKPVHAPAMREVPLSSNPEALKFAEALFEGKFDAVVFLTGVGARALSNVVEGVHPTEKFFEALRGVSVIARGPKPVAVLREWKVPVALAAPEPNTWREVLEAIDDNKLDLRGKQVAVQEYGVSNLELLEGLRERGGCCYRCASLPMGIAAGYGAAADGGGGSNREADRRGAVYHQRADSSSFPDCRTRRAERCTKSGHGTHREGLDRADDFGNSALLRIGSRSGGFSPEDGISREGSSGTVGSIVSEDAIAFPVI